MSELELGALLLSYRTRAGLTQEELAERAAVSARSVSDIECGRIRWPQRRTREALAGELELSAHERQEFLRVTRSGRLAAPQAAVPTVSPRPTLPLGPADFTGRGAELAELDLLAQHAAVVVLHGPPGAGKTSTAVHFGHSRSGLFPGGQAFVPAEDVRPGQAVGTARSERTLIVLDDVAPEHEIVAVPGCLVLATAREPHPGDAVIRIGRLPEAAELLRRIIGSERFAAEPSAAAEIVALCAGLPLAVRIVANRLLSRPRWPISHLVAVLRDPQRGLGLLTGADDRLAAAFEATLERLSPAAVAFLRDGGGDDSGCTEVREELRAAELLVPSGGGRLVPAHLARAFATTAFGA